MPIAPIGPRPRLDARSDTSRQSRPRMTVPPLATIGSNDGPPGGPHRVVPVLVRRSSSRNRDDDQQRVVGAGAEHQHVEDALATARRA